MSKKKDRREEHIVHLPPNYNQEVSVYVYLNFLNKGATDEHEWKEIRRQGAILHPSVYLYEGDKVILLRE